MNENNLPIFQEIAKEKKKISEQEMATNYKSLTEKNLPFSFATDLKNLKFGFDLDYFLGHLNAYIKECENDKEPVYSSSRAPEKIIGLADFSSYFSRLGPDEDEANRKDFIANLNKIFIANKFTDQEKTIPPKEKLIPQQNTPPAQRKEIPSNQNTNHPYNWNSHLGYTQTPEPKEDD